MLENLSRDFCEPTPLFGKRHVIFPGMKKKTRVPSPFVANPSPKKGGGLYFGIPFETGSPRFKIFWALPGEGGISPQNKSLGGGEEKKKKLYDLLGLRSFL